MLGHGTMTFQDYLQVLKRRFWLILICGLLFLAVGFGLCFVLPPQYVSQALVIVQQQKVPENYVKPVIKEDPARLASLKEQIFSRSRLEPIVEQFNLFAGGNATMDDRIDATRKAILFTPIPTGSNNIPGFNISFKAPNARTAQQVCAEITSLFVSESLHAREQSAEGTTAFLSQQVADAKRALDEQDAKLAAFQSKYIGRLPGQEQSNLNQLQALTTQLDASTQGLNQLQQEQTFLEAVVSQQTADLQRANSNNSAPPTDPQELQLKALKEQKKELEGLYTPDHPDVVALSRRIDDLQKDIAKSNPHPGSAANTTTVTHPDPPELVRAKAQLRSIQESLSARKQEQARIQEAINSYQSRVEASPLIEEEFKQITRDHEAALQFYNNLLSKTNESTMATNLERGQQGEQFQVLDPPNIPDTPVFPNPYIFSIGGFVLGVLLGSGIAAMLEFLDTSLRTERDIWTFTKLPTLATISFIATMPQTSKKRKRERGINKLSESTQGGD